MTLPQRSSGSPELREEIRHTLAARQVGDRSQDARALRDWQKEMYAITLGCGIPIVAIGAWVGGLPGVVVVCVILAIMSIAVTWRAR